MIPRAIGILLGLCLFLRNFTRLFPARLKLTRRSTAADLTKSHRLLKIARLSACAFTLVITTAHSADRIFIDGFENLAFRGTNLAGMEMFYADYDQDAGPVADTDYPIYDTRVIDYFASKNINAFRFLFSWEAVQPHLGDTIPSTDGGNYQAYFANYQRIVNYATNVKGIHVIIEPWQADSGGNAGGPRWRGNLVGGGTVTNADFANFWGQMAAAFSGNPLVSYGLVNEPNNMSTMQWFGSAQAAITAIRNAGSTQRIFVPGNGYTAASGWTANYYDTASPARSNAYGWLNANGVGQPLSDPANNIVAEVHTYVDPEQGGLSDEITSLTAAREQIAVALDEANAHGYQIYLGEIGVVAGTTSDDGYPASDVWENFVDYFLANQGVMVGFTWWAGGMPDWWNDLHAPHFSISPTDDVNFVGDTTNMQMIETDF